MTVAVVSPMNLRNQSLVISCIMSVDGIMTGGGVAVVSSTAVLLSTGEEIQALQTSSVRRALRYAPRSPMLSYSSMEWEVIVV